MGRVGGDGSSKSSSVSDTAKRQRDADQAALKANANRAANIEASMTGQGKTYGPPETPETDPDTPPTAPPPAKSGSLVDQVTALLPKIVADVKTKVLDALKGGLSKAALAVLEDCAQGLGPLAMLKPGCGLLMKGLKLGQKVAAMLDMSIPDPCPDPEPGTKCLAMNLDLNSWFGTTNMPRYPLLLSRNPKQGFSLLVKIPGGFGINIASLLRSAIPNGFGLGPIMDQIIDKLKLDSIDIEIWEIGMTINNFAVRVQGKLNLFKIGCSFEIFLGKVAGKWAFAIDMQIPGAFINTFINNILGSAAKAVVPFAITQLDFTLSTDKAPMANYVGLGWNGVRQIQKGLALSLSATFNPRSTNPFFKLLYNAMPGVFQISISYDGNLFTLSLVLPDITFNAWTMLTGLSLNIAGQINPPQMFVGVACYLKTVIGGSSLLFGVVAQVDFLKAQFSLTLTMEGTWTSAFGIKKLAIGDLIGSVGISAVPPWITKLEMGGTITIGEIGQQDVITGKMYFRFDLFDPMNNYFYGSVNRLVIGQFACIVFGACKFPKLIYESGFPKGLTLSFATADTTTPSGDFVPGGFYFKGSLNILGVGGEAEVIMGATRFKFAISLIPFKLGSLQLSKSQSNTAEGPFFNVDLKFNPPSFLLELEAYVKFVIFEFYAKIKLDDGYFMVQVSTPFLVIFDATIKIEATYGSFSSASVKFDAKVETGKAKDAIMAAVNGFKAQAEAAFNAATDKMNAAKRAVEQKAAEVKADCKRKCNLNCNFLEMDAEERAINFLEVNEHGLLDSSVEEYMMAMDYAEMDAIANLPESSLIAMGVMVDDTTANFKTSMSDMDATLRHLGQHGITDLSTVDENVRSGVMFAELESLAATGDQEALAIYLEVSAEMKATLGWGWKPPRPSWPKISLPNIGAAIRGAFNKVGSAIKSVGNTIVSGVKKAATWVANTAVKVGKAVASGACKVAAMACSAGCDVVKGVMDLGAGAVGLAVGLVNLAKMAVSGLLSIINTILNGFDLKFGIGGSLNTAGFEFYCNFMIRFGAVKLEFGVSINFQFARFGAIIDMVWQRMKNYMLDKIPGLRKLVNG